MKTDRPYFVGIAGGSASGKTSFLKALLQAFPEDEISLVSQDNYYRPPEEQQRDANGWLNFDLPDSLYRDEFQRDLQALSRGEVIRRQEYTFNNPAVTPGMVEVRPTPIVVTEGLFVFHYEEVRQMLDYKVFLHADDRIRLARRIERDARERGYPEAEVRYQWENHVMPADRQYLQPYRPHCDLIVQNNAHFEDGLIALVNHLKQRMNA